MPSDTFQLLKAFLEEAPVARKAMGPLSQGAEVSVVLDGGEQARFTMKSGEPQVLAEPACDPDFTLRLPELAVRRLSGLASDDVGAYGVEFFTLALSKDPATRIRIHIDAPTMRILGHGYLGVLAVGGVKVAMWLLAKGVRNPKAAIDRLRGVG